MYIYIYIYNYICKIRRNNRAKTEEPPTSVWSILKSSSGSFNVLTAPAQNTHHFNVSRLNVAFDRKI